jgi:hemerythrin
MISSRYSPHFRLRFLSANRGRIHSHGTRAETPRGKAGAELMTIIDWSSNYETGNALVDSQHYRLFELVNTLHEQIVLGRADDILGNVLTELNRYVAEHFSAEEQLMSAAGYPGAAGHKILHSSLADKALDLKLRHQAGTLKLGLTVSQFLSQWLTEHILIEDRKMIDWIRTQRGARERASGSFPAAPLYYPSSGSMPVKEGRLKDAMAAARESVGRLMVAQGKKSGDK